MRSSRLGSATALVALLALAYAGARPVGPLPPLGPLLDPANGLFASVQTAELPPIAAGSIPGLGADVSVTYDDRGVPHIFAASTADAYRALGYVVARDRLFQIELQTRAGGGTLTELSGVVALPLDQATRALGMPRSAEHGWRTRTRPRRRGAGWRRTPKASTRSRRGLARRDMPFEYKLLGRTPYEYSALDMMHLLNRMGYTLASSEDELRPLRAASLVGAAAADALFPFHAPIVEPIQPSGQTAAGGHRHVARRPGTPDSAGRRVASNALGNADFACRLWFAPNAGRMRWAATTGRSRRRARPAATRCSPATRTSS